MWTLNFQEQTQSLWERCVGEIALTGRIGIIQWERKVDLLAAVLIWGSFGIHDPGPCDPHYALVGWRELSVGLKDSPDWDNSMGRRRWNLNPREHYIEGPYQGSRAGHNGRNILPHQHGLGWESRLLWTTDPMLSLLQVLNTVVSISWVCTARTDEFSC